VSSPKISDIIIDINQMSIKFDRRGRQIIYLNGKIDLSCCFSGALVLEFFNSDDKLIQKATSDSDGNFKIKSITGNLFDLKDDKIKFNFSKVKTFDQNADIRFAEVKHNKRSLGSELKTVDKNAVLNKTGTND